MRDLRQPTRAATYRPPRPIQRGAAPSVSRDAVRASWATPKRLIWTGAFAAVAIVGSIYGVGLKTQEEFKAERKQILETPVEERILSLEAHRAQLVNLRRPLELKREELLLRLQKQQQEEEQKQSEGKPAETPNKCP
ncbi:hypothetical protein F5B17DRAFT_398236 [Nemania serpens]|nr:hypothetical protein F5B17DRAFT_398236 [Nemania serpens]